MNNQLHDATTMVRRAAIFRLALLAGLAVAWMSGVAVCSAGQLTAPALPSNTNSAMNTLNDIYNRLTTGATNNVAAFAEPASGPTGGTMHTLEEVYSNAVPCRVPRTGQTYSVLIGDDGYWHKGMAWPNPRFTIGTNVLGQPFDTNCVLDNLTGLMWTRDTSNACSFASAAVDWTNAVNGCTNLTYGGYHDWRLPNCRELRSLLVYAYTAPSLCNTVGTGPWTTQGSPWNGMTTGSRSYWMSDPTGGNALTTTLSGYGFAWAKTSLYYVWPVRGPVQQ